MHSDVTLILKWLYYQGLTVVCCFLHAEPFIPTTDLRPSSRLCIIEQPSPTSITIRVRQRIHLRCRVMADPAPTYQWLRSDTWLQGQTSSELKVRLNHLGMCLRNIPFNIGYLLISFCENV